MTIKGVIKISYPITLPIHLGTIKINGKLYEIRSITEYPVTHRQVVEMVDETGNELIMEYQPNQGFEHGEK